MALISGIAGQFGFAQETTWGTPVTVNRFVQFVDESVQTEVERLESDSIIQGALIKRSSQWALGLRKSEGDIGLELMDNGIGVLLYHAMGSMTVSGTGPFTYILRPAELSGKGLTLQFGRPARSGTVVPFTYAGAKVQSWEMGLSVGEVATFGVSVVARSETTGISLAVPSYPTATKPLTFVNGSFTLGNTSLCVRSATISGENNLDTDRVCLGQNVIDQPVDSDYREITGDVEVEFGSQGGGTDLELYNRYVNGEEATVTFTVRNSTSTASITLSGNCRFDGETPTVGGREILTHNLNCVFLGTNSDASAMTMTYVTSESFTA